MSQHIAHTMPKLALSNTEGFVMIYRELDRSKKKALIDSLQYFDGPESYEQFNSNLDSIEGELAITATRTEA